MSSMYNTTHGSDWRIPGPAIYMCRCALKNKVYNNKQLLDEVFVISRTIKVEVRVISQSRRLRLITLTENLEVMFLLLH